MKSIIGEINKDDWYVLLLIWGDDDNTAYKQYLSFKDLTEILPQFTVLELDGNLKEFERMPIPKEWIDQKTYNQPLDELIIYGHKDIEGRPTKLCGLDQINGMFESDKLSCSKLSIDYYGDLKVKSKEIHIVVQKGF